MKRVIFGKLALSALLLAAPLSSAGAADLPIKTPYAPAPMPMASWTGCYIGGNGGETWVTKGDINVEQIGDIAQSDDLGTASGTGWALGGQVGCDYQVNNYWVIGVRGMWDWTNVKGSTTGTVFDDEAWTPNFKTTTFATAVARVGYLLTPTLMFYGLGGVATAHDQYSIGAVETTTDEGTIGTASETRTGWDAGLGTAWMFLPNWDLWIEYDYMDFGQKSVFFNPEGPVPFGFEAPILNISQTVQKILVGVDYRFATAR